MMSTDSNYQNFESASIDSHLSELSTSPNETNHFPTRSPKKIKQPILSPDLPSIETSFSNQIATLLETIKEKDLFIGNLQEQHEKDRLQLQRQYKTKENDNEILIKEQHELTQRIEDLQFQLESNNSELIIPDDHHLLSSDDIRIYEELKEKVIELESINKKLIQEKLMFQEELKQHNESTTFTDQLKKQIELLKLQVIDLQNKEQVTTTQMAAKEAFYQQEIEEYQSKIEQITEEQQNVRLQLTTLEQQQQINEKQVNDLVNELKRYQESIVPDLEKQYEMVKSELENQDQTDNLTLNEREIYYEQQIKEYQENLNQATYETENIRAELKQIQEENNIKEEKKNALINELKQNYERLQIELNDRERQIDMSLNQCEPNYEQQIKEYENNLNQAARETQNIQAELARLEEEKILHDNKSNSIISSLKQEYEKQYEILRMQLTELQNQDQTQDIILNERIGHYEIQIKEYQIKIDEYVHERENLLDELKSLKEEKTAHEQHLNKTIETLKQGYQELQTEIDELNERELKAHKISHQHDAQFEQQISEYEQKLEKANLETQRLQSELEKFQEEKTNFNDTINTLTQDLETLKTELQDRDQTPSNEQDAHYESEIKEYKAKIEQALLQIPDLKSKLTNLQEEKTTMEDELNQTIDTLKQDYEKLQNERELEADDNLHQLDAQSEQRVREGQEKLEQANLTIQRLQSDLDKLKEEKKESNDTINSLTQDLETLRAQLEDRDGNQNGSDDDYKTKIEQALLEIQDLQSKLKNLQVEKITIEDELNQTINTLKQDYEKLQNEQKQKEKQILKECQSHYEHEIDEYQRNLELSICQVATIQLQLVTLQEEKTESNDTINSLTQDLETLKTELQDRDKTAFSEQDAHYESEINEHKAKIEEALLQIQDLESKLTNLQEEKTTMEDELNQTIDTLKQDYEKRQNKQELEANDNLHQLDLQFEQRVREDQEKLEQANLTIQRLQSDLDKLQEEKRKSNDTINSLTQDLETLKTGLQDRDGTHNESDDDYKAKVEQSILEIQDLQSKLTNLQEEKTTMTDELNQTINTLKQDYEKLQNEQKQKEKQILKECQSQYEHEIDEYQRNLELSICQVATIQLQLVTLQEEKESNEETLNNEMNLLKTHFEEQIQLLKTQIIELQKLDKTKEKELKEYRSELDQTDELHQRIENLTFINKKLTNELEDIKNQHDPTEIDQLTQQVNDLQKMHLNLLEKQATRDQEYVAEKTAQETLFKEKIDEYDMKLRLTKNEFMVEMENTKLDHEQEILRLKAQIPKLPPPKGKK